MFLFVVVPLATASASPFQDDIIGALNTVESPSSSSSSQRWSRIMEDSWRSQLNGRKDEDDDGYGDDEWSILERTNEQEEEALAVNDVVPTNFGVIDRQSNTAPIESDRTVRTRMRRRRRPSVPGSSLQSKVSFIVPSEKTTEEEEGTLSSPLDGESGSVALSRRLKKTGTTIAGCCAENHVILAADTRATEATMVADKTCLKLHTLASNAWCCGAGTSADLDHLTKQCLYSMALQRLQYDGTIGNANTHDGKNNTTLLSRAPTLEDDDDDDGEVSSSHLLIGPVSIEALCSFLRDALYKAKGNLGANLILGGVWENQAHLRAIHPHGSMDVDLPYAALGSGGLAAMGVLERGYKQNLTVDQGIELVQAAIVAGIRNDLGSGSQVDLCVIAPDGTSRVQRCVVPEEVLDNNDIHSRGPESKETSSSSEEASLGVNGFGNLPFGVQSKKVCFVGAESKEKERLSQWNDALGL